MLFKRRQPPYKKASHQPSKNFMNQNKIINPDPNLAENSQSHHINQSANWISLNNKATQTAIPFYAIKQ